MKVAIVTSGYFPIPPTKGGAVESLVQYIVDENERQQRLELVVYSCFDEEAERKAAGFTGTKFKFVKTPVVVRAADRLVYAFAKHVLRKEKHLSYRYILQRLHFIKVVGWELSRSSFDRIVIENHPTLLGVLGIGGNFRRYEGKCIYHCHNVVSNFFGREQELLGCRRILGVSRFILDDLRGRCGGALDVGRLSVLKNRVDERALRDVDVAEVKALCDRYSISAGVKVVMFAGRLCEGKGALELIEAFSRLEMSDSVLLILGSYYFGSSMSSTYEEALRNRAEALGDRVIFTGFVDHAEMGAFYALADVVAVPSIWNDAAPLSVVEPLTAGRPLVTTRVGGIPEYATDGVDSVVLDVDDRLVENLANAIDGILCGDVVLEKRDPREFSIASYYNDFVELVGR